MPPQRPLRRDRGAGHRGPRSGAAYSVDEVRAHPKRHGGAQERRGPRAAGSESGSRSRGAPRARETDERRLGQRQKQIDFGKNTTGYDHYCQAVPREKRTREQPQTPDITRKCSKRAFDGLVKQWRRLLHTWDDQPQGADADKAGSGAGGGGAMATAGPGEEVLTQDLADLAEDWDDHMIEDFEAELEGLKAQLLSQPVAGGAAGAPAKVDIYALDEDELLGE